MKRLAIFLGLFLALYCVQAQTDELVDGKPAFCSLAPVEGTSADGQFMIYLHYDAVKDKCYPFKYLGSGGNENRFVSERDCIKNCSSSAATLYPSPDEEACHLPKTSGECFGQYLRYYYDAQHKKCKKFLWTGCAGNGNRFLDQLACNSTCHGVEDPETDPEEDEPDTPVGLILGVVFGIIGAGILVAVIVLAMKTKPSGGKKKGAEKGTRAAAEVERTEAPLQADDIEMS
ncbi:BPTI/Kunitz domain-containing protein [Engraulis encrasicolus]|uniref:BPTI/Kunitz domain-containing protein n=1 Tax=Engraulis encrasicolus TaxID=184585 RepID=UPI002FD4DCE6